jgi:hypothetical protein
MTLGDRLKRWWNPAQWREDHSEDSAGEGFALGREKQLRDSVPQRRRFQGATDDRRYGKYGRR